MGKEHEIKIFKEAARILLKNINQLMNSGCRFSDESQAKLQRNRTKLRWIMKAHDPFRMSQKICLLETIEAPEE